MIDSNAAMTVAFFGAADWVRFERLRATRAIMRRIAAAVGHPVSEAVSNVLRQSALKLVDMDAIDAETMSSIFRKMR